MGQREYIFFVMAKVATGVQVLYSACIDKSHGVDGFEFEIFGLLIHNSTTRSSQLGQC